MKKIRFILGVIICIALAGCGKKEEKAPTFTEYTKTDAGEPYSDWGKCTTGSAKYLDGDSVLVTIYLDDVNSQWLASDEKLIADNMKIACDYLKEQGKLYGKDVNLIYDTSVDGDLVYRLSYKQAFGGSTRVKAKGDKADQLVYSVYDFIENSIDTEAIMEKYNVNSIGYMVFIDGEADRCTAYCYHTKYKGQYYPEFCLMNLRWLDGDNVYPDTYAHEILHIFGAKDLYYTDEYDGTSRAFIDHVYENYPQEIMLGYGADAVAYKDSITTEISKITAYFIGWQNYITEVEEHPYIKSKYQATFSESENTQGANFIEYSVEPRQTRDRPRYGFNMAKVQINSLISVAVGIILLISVFIKNDRLKKTLVAEDDEDITNTYISGIDNYEDIQYYNPDSIEDEE